MRSFIFFNIKKEYNITLSTDSMLCGRNGRHTLQSCISSICYVCGYQGKTKFQIVSINILTMIVSFLCMCDECTCLYIHCISVYGYVFVWKCKLCLPVFVWWTCVVFCIYVCTNVVLFDHMFGWPQGKTVVNHR